MKFISRHHKSRQGFTLTELALVLLLVGVVTGAIWVAAKRVWDGYRVTRTMAQTMATVQNIRDYYVNLQAWPAANTDITATLDSLTTPTNNVNIFPVEMRRNPSAAPGASLIDHMFSNVAAAGSFHVLTERSAAPAAAPINAFRIQLLNLRRDACIQLLVAAPSNDDMVGMSRIGSPLAANTFTFIANGVSTGPTVVTLPITPSVAQAWCSSPAATNNEVDMDFKLHP